MGQSPSDAFAARATSALHSCRREQHCVLGCEPLWHIRIAIPWTVHCPMSIRHPLYKIRRPHSLPRWQTMRFPYGLCSRYPFTLSIMSNAESKHLQQSDVSCDFYIHPLEYSSIFVASRIAPMELIVRSGYYLSPLLSWREAFHLTVCLPFSEYSSSVHFPQNPCTVISSETNIQESRNARRVAYPESPVAAHA